jgi:hypothetical protein
MTWFTKSAKPPSPVQIRAAPPILNLVDAITYRLDGCEPVPGFENIREQLREQSLFHRFDRVAM